MYNVRLTHYLFALSIFGFVSISNAQETPTDTALIEFLGEFDEEDEWIFEDLMADNMPEASNAKKENETIEVNDENTSN